MRFMRLNKNYLAFFPALVMVGCTSQQAMQPNKPVRQGNVQITQTQTIQVKPTPAPVIKPTPVAKPSYNSFSDWKSDFSMRAISTGHDAATIRRLLDSAYLNQQVISLDSGQPEFSKMPWEYVDSAVSDGRVSTGKRKFAEQLSFLSQLQSQYGVNAEIITTI